jgi:aminoglycoside/choline kinase family phosphotransferase
VPIRVHSDAPYENLNTRTTFRVPVAPEATFTYHHCVSVDQPMQSRSVTLPQLAALDRSEGVVLLRLDDRGRVTRADNDPAC